MSWSVLFVGKTANIVNALKENSGKLSGGSKEEYDAALPHLIGILEQNWYDETTPVMRLTAAGHGHDKYRQCTVSLEFLGGNLV